jgi:hypothetical protein
MHMKITDQPMSNTFTLTVNTDGAAFTENRDTEIVRILRVAADLVESEGLLNGMDLRRIRDVNGNRVGFFAIEEVSR